MLKNALSWTEYFDNLLEPVDPNRTLKGSRFYGPRPRPLARSQASEGDDECDKCDDVSDVSEEMFPVRAAAVFDKDGPMFVGSIESHRS